MPTDCISLADAIILSVSFFFASCVMPTDYISLREACKFFPSNPHKNTVIRWANRGVYGVKLKTVRFAGKRLTRKVWVDEFSVAIMGASPDSYADSAVPTTSHAAAEAKLDSLGVV